MVLAVGATETEVKLLTSPMPLSRLKPVEEATVQDRVADCPEVMEAGLALKPLMTGAEPDKLPVVKVWSVEVARLLEASADLTIKWYRVAGDRLVKFTLWEVTRELSSVVLLP